MQDPETGEYVTSEDLIRAWREWRRMVWIMRDIDSGMIQMTISEYARLPEMFTRIRALYISIRDSYTEDGR